MDFQSVDANVVDGLEVRRTLKISFDEALARNSLDFRFTNWFLAPWLNSFQAPFLATTWKFTLNFLSQ